MLSVLKNYDTAFSKRTFGLSIGVTLTVIAGFLFTTNPQALNHEQLESAGAFQSPVAVARIVDLTIGGQDEKTTEVVAIHGLSDSDKIAPPAEDQAHGSVITPPAIMDKPLEKTAEPIEDMVAGIHESKPEGLIPMTRADGATPYQAYKQPFAPAQGTRAVIALVMIDYGLSQKVSEAALKELPSGTSFAVSPYGDDPQAWTSKARSFGHEVWMSIPMQSINFPDNDPGANAILASSGREQKQRRLFQSLGKATGYPGVVSVSEPETIRSKIDMNFIMSELAARGLGYIESDPSGRDSMQQAVNAKVPNTIATVWLDSEASPAAVKKILSDIETHALEKQKAVVFFRPAPATIKTLQPWIAGLKARNIEIAPASAVIDLK